MGAIYIFSFNFKSILFRIKFGAPLFYAIMMCLDVGKVSGLGWLLSVQMKSAVPATLSEKKTQTTCESERA